MGWKEWPMWFRGLSIGILIGLIYGFSLGYDSYFGCPVVWEEGQLPIHCRFLLPFDSVIYTSSFIIAGYEASIQSQQEALIIISAIFFGCFGLLIGWFIGKLKSGGTKK